MRTWETIKELTENPNKVFERVSDKKRFTTSTKVNGGQVVAHYVSDLHTSFDCITLTDEWELVGESVDFMTAINSGKRIKPCTIAAKNHGFHCWDYWELSLDIINGKWLIE